jgi:lipopolysaccharide export system permease protein
MKTLDRYLLKQIAGPFVFGVLAFVLLFISGNVLLELAELVSQLGLSIWVALEIFALRLPGFVVLTFPLATLVAVLIVFGRLSGDSELVAMFAGGVNFRRLVVPILLFGLIVSVATAALNEFVVPASERRAEEIVREATVRAGGQYEQGVVRRELVNGNGRVIIAERLDLRTEEMTRLAILGYKEGKPVSLIVAEKARWRGSDWQLINGTTYLLNAKYPTSAAFEVLAARFSRPPEELLRASRRPEEMTFHELRAHIQETARQGLPTTRLELTLYHKLSIPFAGLVFALLAPALGMRSHRGSGSIGMGLAILIGFGYYLVWNYLVVIAREGGLDPRWAAWLPNLVTAVIGAGLVMRVRK